MKRRPKRVPHGRGHQRSTRRGLPDDQAQLPRQEKRPAAISRSASSGFQTDHLDLWQFHSIERVEDPNWIFAPHGAIEAAELAKQQGKVRFIGFTGHKSPDYHLKMLTKPYDWDALQMPLNVLDPHFGSFERKVLPEAVKRNLGIVGMKPMAFQNAPKTGVISSIECLHYAMSLPVSVTITGCENDGAAPDRLGSGPHFQAAQRGGNAGAARPHDALRQERRERAVQGHEELRQQARRLRAPLRGVKQRPKQ